jgi:hypothetical protein
MNREKKKRKRDKKAEKIKKEAKLVRCTLPL